MNRDEAIEALELLSAEFDIPIPILTWTAQMRNGRCYYPSLWGRYRSGRVAIGPNCWRGAKNCLLHEFAHILAFHRGSRHHDGGFWNALREVAEVWLGDATRYAWRTEYKTGVAYGRRLKQGDA